MWSFFCLFHQILCNIYLFSNLVDHLFFLGHVVLVEEPLAVTNILDSGGVGSNPAVTISYFFLHFHFFFRFLFFCDHFKAKGEKRDYFQKYF
jgi:hypothetical protein